MCVPLEYPSRTAARGSCRWSSSSLPHVPRRVRVLPPGLEARVPVPCTRRQEAGCRDNKESQEQKRVSMEMNGAE